VRGKNSYEERGMMNKKNGYEERLWSSLLDPRSSILKSIIKPEKSKEGI